MQTIICQRILDNVQRSLKAACVSCPDIMLGCILDEAQELANQGFRWDVALAKAVQIYPSTKYAATGVWK